MQLFSFSLILAGVGGLMMVHPKIFTNHLRHLFFVPLFKKRRVIKREN
jgi:cytochrome b subunit of formate dehydrogenase